MLLSLYHKIPSLVGQYFSAFCISGFNVRKPNYIYKVQISVGTTMHYLSGGVYFEGRHCINLQKLIFPARGEFFFLCRQLTARSKFRLTTEKNPHFKYLRCLLVITMGLLTLVLIISDCKFRSFRSTSILMFCCW